MSIAPSLLLFEPPSVDYTTATDQPLFFDLTTAMASIGVSTAVLPTAKLTDLKDDSVITPSPTPTMVGANKVQLVLDGSQLTPGRQYRLEIGWTPQGTTDVVVQWVQVNCLF